MGNQFLDTLGTFIEFEKGWSVTVDSSSVIGWAKLYEVGVDTSNGVLVSNTTQALIGDPTYNTDKVWGVVDPIGGRYETNAVIVRAKNEFKGHLLTLNGDTEGYGPEINIDSADSSILLGDQVEIFRSEHLTAFYSGDDILNMGVSNRRLKEIFCVNGVITTSDERGKNFSDIEDAEKKCALDIKSHINKFKWKDAVSEKGTGARIHFGVGAQTVKTVFESYGLDPDSYSLFCYDVWDEEIGPDGAVITEAGNRYGLRYSELTMFILAALQ